MKHNNELERQGLPTDPFRERLILGGLVTGQADLVTVRAELTSDDFSLESHRYIYRAICDLADQAEPLDYYTVGNRLNTEGHLEAVTLSYLIDLNENAPRPVDLGNYIKCVKNAAVRRRMIYSLDGGINELAVTGNPEEVLEKLQKLTTKAAEELKPRIQGKSPSQVILSVEGGANGYFYPHQNRKQILTPWSPLNDIIGGFRPRQLIVIGGYTGQGKSAAAAQIAEHAARCGHGVALFSFEMDAQDILVRMTCARASVNTHRFQGGGLDNLHSEQRDRFLKATSEMRELDPLLWINETSGSTITDVQAVVRQLCSTMPLSLVIVDYIQLMNTTHRYENRVQQITEITQGLKTLAREMNLAVIGLSQLNRASQDGSPPGLKHLRESGSIEQDADIVILLHPHKEENFNGVRSQAIEVDMLVEKHRGGPTGRAPLLFQRGYTRFDEIAPTINGNGGNSHHDRD